MEKDAKKNNSKDKEENEDELSKQLAQQVTSVNKMFELYTKDDDGR